VRASWIKKILDDDDSDDDDYGVALDAVAVCLGSSQETSEDFDEDDYDDDMEYV
jgi:hypothetical protein